MDGYVTLQQMAAMHGVDPQTIRLILWADVDRPPEARKLPGAIKVGGKRRGVWYIPRAVAEAWARDPRGRKNRDA